MAELVAQVRTVDGRVIGVCRNGSTAVRLSDHPDPHAHAGYSINFEPTRELAEALLCGGSVRVSTCEGRVLILAGMLLGDQVAMEQQPDGLNPQAASRPRGPWRLEEHQRQVLAEALLDAAG
jgi:hypothetical protein